MALRAKRDDGAVTKRAVRPSGDRARRAGPLWAAGWLGLLAVASCSPTADPQGTACPDGASCDGEEYRWRRWWRAGADAAASRPDANAAGTDAGDAAAPSVDAAPPPPPPVDAGPTIPAASCAQADVQRAIDGAGTAAVVAVPAGDCAWASAVTIRNKNVTLLGAGKDATIIRCQQCVSITSTSSTSEFSHWRLSGMTFKGAAPGGIMINIWDNVSSWHYGWRIDHMKFDYPGAGSGYGVFVGGATYGLLDHNEWIWGNGLAVIVAAQMADEYPASTAKPQGGYLLSQPLDLGTYKAVYIEDSTYTSTAPGGAAVYDTSSGGGRAVFRNNTVTGGIYYSHWTRNLEVGGLVHEIYRNKFVGNAAFKGYPVRLEAGTGVVFENTMIGFDQDEVVVDERRGFMESSGGLGACDGTHGWDGNRGDPAAPGWPCLGQIGRAPGVSIAQIMAGQKQASSPLHLWKNGAQDGCRTGGACTNTTGVGVYDGSTKATAYVRATPHPNGEVDYILGGNTPKAGYAPYTYPHPLQTGRAP